MTDTSTSEPPTSTKKNKGTAATASATTTTTTTTPTATTDASSTALPSTTAQRWQHARIEEDPIIAPGYGRQSDLERLTSALNRESAVKLPVSAVEALMKAKGRGIRSSQRAETPRTGRSGTSAATSATPVSSAWADFMKEEGVTLAKTGGSTTASSTTAAAAKNDSDASSDKGKTVPSGTVRQYKSLPWDIKAASRVSKKQRKSDLNGGILIQSGTLDVTVVGRGKISKTDIETNTFHCIRPTVLHMPTPIAKVFSAGHSVHVIAIDAGGKVYGWGRNEGHQLGSSQPSNVYWPTELPDEALQQNEIVQAATGKSHTLFLSKQGQVFALGSNKMGQCGVKPGPASEKIGTARLGAVPEGVEIAEIACGEDFSMAISTAGRLYSTGCSQYGQLGSGETGEYFITANKLAFSNCAVWTIRDTFCAGDEKVTPLPDTSSILVRHVACGKHHTLLVEASAEDHKPRIFSFGCGDYGCLGHGIQKDEYFPRQIAVLENAPTGDDSEIRLVAGNSCSMLQTSAGHVYYWGKHRSVGEAQMRPQLVDVLANNQHVVTHTAAGFQVVACTTEHAQTVVWGQEFNGGLGLKSGAKSSSKPTFVEDLTGAHVQSMVATTGGLVYVVSAEDEKIVAELNVLHPEDVSSLSERASTEATTEPAKKKGKRKG